MTADTGVEFSSSFQSDVNELSCETSKNCEVLKKNLRRHKHEESFDFKN